MSGRSLVGLIENSQQTVTLKVNTGTLNSLAFFMEQGGVNGSHFNPRTKTISLQPAQANERSPLSIILGHELIHAYHNIILGIESSEAITRHGLLLNPNASSINRFENICIPNLSENVIRDELGLGSRRN